MPLTDPVPSSAFDVLERNIQDTDKFANQETGTFTNRVGKEIKPIPVIEAEANAAVISLGWHQVGLFADGFTYTLQNDIAKDTAGDWYRWNGVLPKVVTAGTLPSSDANFVKIDYKSHAELSDRNPANGSAHNADDVNFTNYADQTAKFKQYVGGDGPVGISTRDPFLVSRELTGQTDCHAFADKTVISNATDAGTYGTFDSTTEIAGTHIQSHQFSFQNRAKFSGEGAITTWGGYISWPVLTGAVSTVNELFHFEARDLDSQGRFDAVTNQFGIKVYNQTKGMAGNYAYWTTQNWNGSTGYSFHSSGTGKMLQAGEAIFSSPVIFGASVPVAGAPISWTGGVGKQKGFVNSSATGIQYGVVGDYSHTWVSNSAERLILEGSAENYALRPASSTQNLGTVARSFNIARLKQINFTPITSAEATNLSLFVNSVTGALSFKDSVGVVKVVTLT